MDSSFLDSINNQNVTARGTRIVKKGESLDKDAFLKILTSELSNQDPMNTKDSTEYIAQMAQFSSLEQMANLNSTMTFSSASNLIGKNVELTSLDPLGNKYIGNVKTVEKLGDTIKLNVEVEEPDSEGNYSTKVMKEFTYDKVSAVAG